jgi:hypothetical protein
MLTDMLAVMRQREEATLTDAATITRATRVSDGMGGYTATWATAGTANCRYTPFKYQMVPQNIADALANITAWTVKFAIGTDIQLHDHIAVSGHAMEVMSVIGPKTVEITRNVLATEVIL